MRIHLQEGRTIDSGDKAEELLSNGKLAGRLGGKKFIPVWLFEQTSVFKDLVDVTLSLFDANDPNLASDEVVQFLVKASATGPEKWQAAIEQAPDTITYLARAFASQWFTKGPEYIKKIEALVAAPSFELTAWHNLEKDIQDELEKRDAKRGKKAKIAPGATENSLYSTLYDDDEWKLFIPKTQEGDSQLASHMKPFKYGSKIYYKTRWCTAAGVNMWNNYRREGNCYYVVQHWVDGEYVDAWQAAFCRADHVEFMDKCDERNYESLLKEAPREMLKMIVCDNPNSVLQGTNILALQELAKSLGTNNIDTALRADVSDLTDELKDELLEKFETVYVLPGSRRLVAFADADLQQDSFVIPNGIEEISKLPAVMAKTCRQIVLPDTVTSIASGAFKHFKVLTDIKMPTGLTSLGSSAFEKSGIISVDFSACTSLNSIPESCFASCKDLTEVTLPSNLKSIESSAFEDCQNLEYVDLPEGLEVIKSAAFDDSGLTSITIPESVKELGIGTFANCEKLEYAKLPTELEKCGIGTFMMCEELKKVDNMQVLKGIRRSFMGCDELDTSAIED